MPPTSETDRAIRTIGIVMLAGVLLLTVALAFLREIGVVDTAFFWVAAVAFYLIVARAHRTEGD